MAVAISTLSAYTPTTVGPGVISSTNENAFRSSASGITALVNNLLTVATSQENMWSSASGSPPTDKPAGKIWFQSDNQLWTGYPTAAGVVQKFVTDTNTLTLTNKTLTSPTITTPTLNTAITTGASTVIVGSTPTPANGYQFPDVAARTINISGVDQNSYISGAGTGGTTTLAGGGIKSVTIKANSLNGLARGFRLLLCMIGSASAQYNIDFAGFAFLSNVNLTGGGTVDVTILYNDATHFTVGGFFTQDAGPATSLAINQPCSALTSDRTVRVGGDGTHTITVYAMMVLAF